MTRGPYFRHIPCPLNTRVPLCTPLKKSRLERILGGCPGYVDPSPRLEQYTTSADVAADVLSLAFLRGDIRDRVVLDMGCGTGMFACGAALLGAGRVIGVDLDREALSAARTWAADLGVEVELLHMDISEASMMVDTALGNPPFGVRRRHADRAFIRCALRCARRAYTLHYGPTEEFLRRYVAECGGEVLAVKNYKSELRHTFPSHRRRLKQMEVVLLVYGRGGEKYATGSNDG